VSEARTAILGRVRQICAHSGQSQTAEAEWAGLPRNYRLTGRLDPAACLDLFVDRLQEYGVDVVRCRPQSIPATIADVLARRGRRRLVIPPELPRAWLTADGDYRPDAGLTYADLDRSDGALTGCTVGIALTGTIVLCHTGIEGRRALTLLPDYHLCLVWVHQIVETVPEGLARIGALAPRLVTTISGPSATADIEMTRVSGVHGPRTLDVVVVED
jgi:L-lactate dehydrogenase complex protein LldG